MSLSYPCSLPVSLSLLPELLQGVADHSILLRLALSNQPDLLLNVRTDLHTAGRGGLGRWDGRHQVQALQA